MQSINLTVTNNLVSRGVEYNDSKALLMQRGTHNSGAPS